MFLQVAIPMHASVLNEGIAAWLTHHDALRLRFSSDATGIQQVVAPDEGPTPLLSVDLSRLSAGEQEIQATRLAEQTQASLDLVQGPLLRVVLLERGDHPSLLLIVIHHLAVDGVSWRILLEDLQQAYQQRMQAQAIALPAKTSSFQAWADRLVAYANSRDLEAEQASWLAKTREQTQPLLLDAPFDEQSNTVASGHVVHRNLTVQETHQLLEEVPAAYHTQINEILLAALARTLRPWMGASRVLVDLEGHGREDLFADVDLSRTVGWFTSVFPVSLDLGKAVTVPDAIAAVKEHLRAIPNHGIGYGILRYLSPDQKIQQELARMQAQISFNYLGQFATVEGSTFLAGASPFSAGSSQSMRGRRSHLLAITAQVSGDRFQITWSYSDKVHLPTTIERLANAFVEALREMIALSQALGMGSYIPADFANVALSQQQIDQIVMEMDADE